MTVARTSERRRVTIRVRGVVQGVGFRPYVFRLATGLDLAGSVRNDPHGVLIDVEGEGRRVARFLERLPAEAPPLASIAELTPTDEVPTGRRGFAVAASGGPGRPDALVAADAATCEDCLRELLDPGDRRHRYPFINCTNCGPRFTIVRDVPYDRAATTMAAFAMCEACAAEYADPRSRRFHAQPNACPDCGPRLELCPLGAGDIISGPAALAATVAALDAGQIAAIKGIGGYHLACRADSERAVAALRARKHREDRPFALMVAGLDRARELIELSPAEEALLTGRERPIVIARRRPGAGIADAVAPGTGELGVMLAYSPLHHLLAADAGVPLVMTSGNVADEPIAHVDEDAGVRLAAVADLILTHDRPIHVRADDSVVRAVDPDLRREPLLIRRSRGYVPGAIALPVPARRPVLGCGAELKSTFCLAKGSDAWVSHHIGDLRNFETLCSYREGVSHFERLFAARPSLVAHDLHPDYLSTRYALERGAEATLAVQHHHAHLAAVLAEHGETGPAVGAIFDGAGLGPDDTVWGGELLVGGLGGYEREGFLFPVRMPGGDAAAREPWRMACAWLCATLGEECPRPPADIAAAVDRSRWEAICDLVRTGTASPVTTSAGRLFDAVASLCGIRHRVAYEGQAAAELEAAARRAPDPAGATPYPIAVAADGDGPLLVDPRETIAAIAADRSRRVGAEVASARFHAALATASASACARLAERHGTDAVVLAGGVFQSRLLIEATTAALRRSGLRVLLPLLLPPNDGAIAYGQVAIAACADDEAGE